MEAVGLEEMECEELPCRAGIGGLPGCGRLRDCMRVRFFLLHEESSGAGQRVARQEVLER